MRVGVDGRKIPKAVEYGPLKSFTHARELGLEGLFFRTVLEMSPTLDHGEMREIKAHADSLGMYCESGLGKVNPYASPEAPELRAAGDGDILLGFRRMLEACRAADITEVWIGTANYKGVYKGYWAYDRFRTDVTWAEQLEATGRFLKKLAPMVRDLGMHMNMETHEEISSFEVVRLVEATGPDVMGITFDIPNVTQRGEAPVEAAKRVAPYVRQTHLKDIVHVLTPEGTLRQVRPCGQGMVDFEFILPLLYQHNPSLHLTIENPNTAGHTLTQVFDPVWNASHPDLSVSEYAEFIRLAQLCTSKIAAGEWVSIDEYDSHPFDYAREVWYIQESAAYLRAVCEKYGLGQTLAAAGAAR
ncbi:MAG: sugar phosphate isomerase/epimerase [Chloroflexi bacterium]|nr:sugar phosphate isomerase/epimerase [Chloroflexota bacterium]